MKLLMTLILLFGMTSQAAEKRSSVMVYLISAKNVEEVMTKTVVLTTQFYEPLDVRDGVITKYSSYSQNLTVRMKDVSSEPFIQERFGKDIKSVMRVDVVNKKNPDSRFLFLLDPVLSSAQDGSGVDVTSADMSYADHLILFEETDLEKRYYFYLSVN